MRKRVSAVVIKDKKLLMVTGHKSSYFWTAGGEIEAGETHEEALKRELKEELGVGLKSARQYISYISKWRDRDQTVHCFIAEISGKIIPQNEIAGTFWYSKENFLKKDPEVAAGIKKNLIPQLIKDRLL